MQKVLHEEPAAPGSVHAGLPKSLDAVVTRAMAKRPEQRYATWAEFALELATAVKLILPPDAIPDSEKYVALKSVGLLSGLSDAELWELARAGRWQRFAAKQPVITENTPGQSFFLAQGQVKVTKQGRLLNMIDKKEFFGKMAYIRG
ncbi:MAG: hypothetical protein FJY55_07645, partial [Betaproteobacteria bacterium]|nr:hypothetical protein [Betaproteobacteria bacterium]